jgi:hypothetical protein
MRSAREKRAALIDATLAITTVHQDHGYGHVPGIAADAGEVPIYESAEGRRNLATAGGDLGLYTVFDATHVMMPDRQLKSTCSPWLVHRRLKASTRRVVRTLRNFRLRHPTADR